MRLVETVESFDQNVEGANRYSDASEETNAVLGSDTGVDDLDSKKRGAPRARRRLRLVSSVGIAKGLEMKSSQPAAMLPARLPGSALAARIGILLWNGWFFMIAASSNPLITGIRMSKRMTSGAWHSSLSIASAPLLARIASQPITAKNLPINSRRSGWSSTTSTVFGISICSNQTDSSSTPFIDGTTVTSSRSPAERQKKEPSDCDCIGRLKELLSNSGRFRKNLC